MQAKGISVGEFAVGQGVARFEDPRLLRGGGRYVDDIVLPRMAVGYVLRSPHAHAKIKSIDVTQAKAAPGVVLVLTGADWKRSGWGDLPVPGGQKRRDGSPMYRSPYPALAQERVRWVGDYVAFVVAETVHQAADAAELIAVEYGRCRRSSRPPMQSSAARRASGRIILTISLLSISKATRRRPTPAFAKATHSANVLRSPVRWGPQSE